MKRKFIVVQIGLVPFTPSMSFRPLGYFDTEVEAQRWIMEKEPLDGDYFVLPVMVYHRRGGELV